MAVNSLRFGDIRATLVGYSTRIRDKYTTEKLVYIKAVQVVVLTVQCKLPTLPVKACIRPLGWPRIKLRLKESPIRLSVWEQESVC